MFPLKKNKQKGSKRRTREENNRLRAQFYRMLEVNGPMNVKPYVVQDELGVAESTLQTWKTKWIEDNGVPQLEEPGRLLKLQAENALSTQAILSRDNDKKIRLQAPRDFLQGLEKYKDFLESWGLKDKIQESIQEHHHKVEISEDKESTITKLFTKEQLEKIAEKAMEEAKPDEQD